MITTLLFQYRLTAHLTVIFLMFLLLLMPGKDAHTEQAEVTIQPVDQSTYDAWLPTAGGTLQFRVTVSNRRGRHFV